MTSANPFEESSRQGETASTRAMIDVSRVVSAPNHTLGDENEHVVQIRQKGVDSTEWAQLAVDSYGDVHIPKVDEEHEVWALVAYVKGELPVVLKLYYASTEDGTVHDIPDYNAGERRLGHNLTDAHVFLDENGHVTIESDGGQKILLKDSEIVINGGTQGVITDVTTTKDADGHVTDISLTRESSIKV